MLAGSSSIALPHIVSGIRHKQGLGGVLLYSGWAVHNIGDIGHTPGTLRYLEEHCPDVPVTLWISRTNEAVTGMLNKRFPNVRIVQGKLNGEGRADTEELQAAFDACRLFVHNSGMIYNRFWPPPKDLLKAGVLEFGPDGCFGVDVRDNVKGDRYRCEQGLGERDFLTITIRTHTRGDLIESNDPEGDEERAARLRSVITSWVQDTGKKVLLAPEVEKEIAAAERSLYQPLPPDIRKQVVWRDTFWNADEAISIYANARAMVAMEPHSLIMGVAMGTPVIHYFLPQHSVKGYMFRDIGLPEWLMKIMEEPPESVSAALRVIDQDFPRAQAKVNRAMDYVNRRSGEMMEILKRSLSNG